METHHYSLLTEYNVDLTTDERNQWSQFILTHEEYQNYCELETEAYFCTNREQLNSIKRALVKQKLVLFRLAQDWFNNTIKLQRILDQLKEYKCEFLHSRADYEIGYDLMKIIDKLEDPNKRESKSNHKFEGVEDVS